MTQRRDKIAKVSKISISLLPREKTRLDRIAEKSFRRNRSAAVAGILERCTL